MSLQIGSAGWIPVHKMLPALSGPATPEDPAVLILLQLRLPRLLLSLLVGANLAVAGAIMQALFTNRLADPFVTGVSSGAALGAVSAAALGASAPWLGIHPPALFALAGAGLVTALVSSMTPRHEPAPLSALLLRGVAIGSIAQALTSLLLFRTDLFQMRAALAWLMGSFAYRDWSYVHLLWPYSLLGLLGTLRLAQPLNLLCFGEETAHHLGLPIRTARIQLLLLASLLAASSVATCGTIGFVGLVVPNLMRRFFGADHRTLLPACILGGALLTLWSDVASRFLHPGQETPVGVVTSLIGGLFFLLSLQKRGSPESVPTSGPASL
jgi:iron complex transport system permease protein